ncbi:MAG: SDR family oxidoreductase [Pseudomonadota bacterium]
MNRTPPWALVTGGGRRLGRAFVEALAGEGYAVAVHVHRSVSDGEALVEALRRGGQEACLLVDDLADPAAPARLLRDLQARGRTPTVLVNNAARFDHDRLASVEPTTFDHQVAVNLRAPLLLCQAFARCLPADADGLIVNLVDQRIARADPNFLSYGLTKAALWAMTRNLAMELAPRVRVNAIAPGLALLDEGMDEATAQRIVGRFPLRTGGPAAEVVDALRYLVRARSVTGQLLAVDGGAHLGRIASPVQDAG